uniref:Survival protein SurE-like phosphatase/nucleotidase domain-containing protein n=1 Tax=Manihot esculenta TaxID=3983 RepID=A0A2C9W8K0_MANES
MVTNDVGIDTPWLRSLVRVLVSTNLFHVLVCAPDSEKSAFSHCITWRHPISAQRVVIEGATAFAVSDKVISGINMGIDCGYHIVYSGTVAGAREAFFNDVPSVSISYDCTIQDFTIAVEACIPIISALLVEIRNQTYPSSCFLNIDLPTNVSNHKGYKLTRQGKSIFKTVWKQVPSGMEGGKMLSTMTMDTNSAAATETGTSNVSQEQMWFGGEITVTPLGALSQFDTGCLDYFKDWLPGVVDRPSPSAG